MGLGRAVSWRSCRHYARKRLLSVIVDRKRPSAPTFIKKRRILKLEERGTRKKVPPRRGIAKKVYLYFYFLTLRHTYLWLILTLVHLFWKSLLHYFKPVDTFYPSVRSLILRQTTPHTHAVWIYCWLPVTDRDVKSKLWWHILHTSKRDSWKLWARCQL